MKMVVIGVIFLLVGSTCLEKNLLLYKTEEFPDTLVISNGQSVMYKKARALIHYQKTIEDSRCPLNVLCFWEGIASINIEFFTPKTGNVQFPLLIHGYVRLENSDAHVPFDTLGYTFRLAALEPYPVDPVEYDYSKYVATIIILKHSEVRR